ncbi:MAG: hypothetical protein VW362_05375 [Candidatus Nanopelagicales bacterium]
MVMIELFMMLWALVGTQFTWHNGLPGQLAGHAEVQGAFLCGSGEGWVRESAPLEWVNHELAHALDCLDDGKMNGSPGHPPTYDWSEYCEYVGRDCGYWRAEHYAQEVVRTGRIR